MGTMLDTSIIKPYLKDLEGFLKNKFEDKEYNVKVKFKDDLENQQNSLNVSIEGKKDHGFVCTFSLSELPGNCGILVSHGLFINTTFQGRGLGQFLQDLKKKIAMAYGYTIMMCTTLENNSVENYLLKKNGWEISNKFLNKRTMHYCIEWKFIIPNKL